MLLAREPFAQITQATLAGFLRARYGGEWQVRWLENGGANGARQRWLCNVHINAIFVPRARHEALEVVRREFARSVAPWKRPLQRAYFHLATSPPFASLLARAALEIEPAVPGAEDLVIVSGTHKLRVVDIAASRVYCCRRSTTPERHFRREVEARTRAAAAGVRVPRILEQPSEDCLVEELLLGTPLNRIADAATRAGALRDALAQVELLYAQTAGRTTVQAYVGALTAEIEQSLKTGGSIGRDAAAVRENVSALLDLLRDEGPSELVTVVAHGDFQAANLLWQDEAVWLIDWEFSARRQYLYDRLVFALRSRFPHGLAARVAGYVADPGAALGGVLAPAAREHLLPARLALALFLLEELALHAAENTNPNWKDLTPEWKQFQSELRLALKMLARPPR